MKTSKLNTILISAITDILVAALIVIGTWYIKCKIPRDGVAVDTTITDTSEEDIADNYVYTNTENTAIDFKTKFADKFSDEVIITDTSYTSPNVSITITHNTYDSGKTSSSRGNSNSSEISYYLADIYVSDISYIQTGFGQDTYGIGYTEDLNSIASRLGAILAVNGDSYGDNQSDSNGTVIRNGVLYRFSQSDNETLVLYEDGSMEVIAAGELDEDELMNNGAYQTWTFGPSLLDSDGKALSTFDANKYITNSHPRTAIGYFEPGHYCLLVVDGRSDESGGMYLDEMAELFEELGCKIAYNLDGGYSSSMYFNGETINDPNKLRTVSDAILIME